MKPPIKRLSDLKGGSPAKGVYAPPTPKVSRQKKAKVLTPAERAAFLASRTGSQTEELNAERCAATVAGTSDTGSTARLTGRVRGGTTSGSVS